MTPCAHLSVYISTRLVEGSPLVLGDVPYTIELAVYCSDCKQHVKFENPQLLNESETVRVDFRFSRTFNPLNN